MTKPLRTVLVVASVTVGLATLAAGQASTTQSAPAGGDALLAEVRAIRADLANAASASIRTQLLVARLQLQEQRINTVARQLSDVQSQLAATNLAPMTSRVRQLETMLRGSLSQEERQSAEQEMAELKISMEDAQRRADGLQNQEATLSNAFSAEQSRWLELSERLDQIERDIARRP